MDMQKMLYISIFEWRITSVFGSLKNIVELNYNKLKNNKRLENGGSGHIRDRVAADVVNTVAQLNTVVRFHVTRSSFEHCSGQQATLVSVGKARGRRANSEPQAALPDTRELIEENFDVGVAGDVGIGEEHGIHSRK